MNNPSAVNLKSHPLKGVSLIEASAGTGKTYTITHLYVRCLLETEYKVNQILVVTFTNAATQELKGRIRELVYEVWNYLTDANNIKSEFDDLFGLYKRNPKAIFSLQEALINFDEASIYSIHGFCQRVLNSFPVETNSLLQQQIIPDERELEQTAIRDFWRLQITNTEINKLRWILSIWIHPDELLNDVRPLLGFEETVKITSQQLDDESDDEKALEVWIELTRLWKNSSEEIQSFLLDSPSLNRARVRVDTVKKLLIQLQDYFTKTIPHTIPEKWSLITVSKLSLCQKKNTHDDRLNLRFFDVADEFSVLHQQWLFKQKLEILINATNSVQQSIHEAKSSAQNISFNDLIKQLSMVLTPDNTSLIKKVTDLYPLAMVDEFQDTDNKQYNIFKNLYQTESNENKTLILIGDPKQAIYSFRGADVFTYQQAKQSTKNHFTLETNYRSSADFIDLVNKFFKFNTNAFIFDQLIEFSNSKTNTKKPKYITDNNKYAEPLVSWIYPFTDKPASKGKATDFFASVCAREIFDILQQKTLQLESKTVEAKDLTILVKTGRQASLMKSKLAELGISSALILRDSVFATDQAREISLLLEVLIEPSNIRRLCGLLSTDLFSWNMQQILNLQKDNQLLVSLLEQMKEYQLHWQQKGILSMFFKLMEDQKTLQKSISYMDGERLITNWIHIVELLQQQSNKHASFSQALHWLLQQREQVKDSASNEEHQLRLESDSDLVRIVTIHKSKGLQYPIVFMPFMWDVKSNKFQPDSYSYHDKLGNKKVMILDEAERETWHQENLAEEIRLFYVAITRAIYRCYVGWGHIKGAGSSAIAHCLFSDHIKKGNYPLNLDLNNEAELIQPFVLLNKQQNTEKGENQLIAFSNNNAGEINQNDNDKLKAAVKQKLANEFSRNIQQQWRISSYSQIASSGFTEEVDRPDYDAVIYPVIENEAVFELDELNRFTFQKGAKAGNFLHDILENQPFDKPVDENLVQLKCNEYGFEEKWVPCLMQWMTDIMECDVGGLQLKKLMPKQKISEMEFYMSSHKLKADELNKLLHQYSYSRPEQVFTFSSINGFLKGFIDLVFEFNGQYFIADYKSNYLGDSIQNYDEHSCKEAMYDHHYHLQYLIYTLALHRFLKSRISDYNYDVHIGGVYYLFLRGMSSFNENKYGVYFHKPDFKVIQQLDGLFNE
ncbi:MAG: exodeoxyribonuclease V subunit beta [Gammaproteobacteria bacterium]|nr:exodeoxyribonuclease V subunit beta [Gammaproteobacteria bacterium]MBT3722400.1 exodeoxyribonuclease V subunit beta [Gammaproteobacteria bacterium]MBT4075290.1 exodeoxyribonuclease V subunit beta [Gammaproteobacteria bacterium]MBT4196208.1 exodeoxyribonuclease V subunit beta [Gammaproteobacteria bacterium]MBT4861232.1 exodeoxyribonuclease V subunit beta [Gammaproteobacteria bacterium]